MTLPVVYDEDYVTPLPDGHRFPMRKFRYLHRYLREHLGDRVRFYECSPVSRKTVTTVHDPNYVRRFGEGNLSDRQLRRIGLPWSPDLVRRTFTAVGGTVRTVQLALKRGLACNGAGGTHHAMTDRGGGFCILNDVAVAAHYAVEHGGLRRTLVVDLDVHQGNGTAGMTGESERVKTFSIHCDDNYPFSPVPGDRDIGLPSGAGDEQYISTLESELSRELAKVKPGLVIYDAGVDVHGEDRLGRLNLTDEGIRERDRLVLSMVLDRGIPLAGVIGGGYDSDVHRLARRHAILHETAADLWGNNMLTGTPVVHS